MANSTLPKEDRPDIDPEFLNRQDVENPDSKDNQRAGGDSSIPGVEDPDGPSAGNLQGVKNSEASGAGARGRYNDSSDDDASGEGGLYKDDGKPKKKKGRGRFVITPRRAAGVVIGSGIIGVVFGGIITQGPLEMIHFSRLLQKFHMSRNEDFGEDRGNKLMLYAMAGKAEKGRLGAVTNVFADKWEKKMIKETGLRPLFNSKTGRLEAYEIISNKKDRFDALREVLDRNPELRDSFQQIADRGAEIRSRDEALARGYIRGSPSRGSSPEIAQNHYIIDQRDIDERGFKQTRVFTKKVGSSVVRSKVVGAIGSRLLIKRGGITMHFFNNVKKKVDRTASANQRLKNDEEYQKNVLKRWADSVKIGVIRGSPTQTDKNGKPNDATAQGQAASDETNKAVEEVSKAGQAGTDTSVLRSKLVAGGGAALAVGVFCSLKDIGKQADEFKFKNTIQVMQRMGFGVIAMGGQEMAGDGLNANEVGVMTKRLYDKEKGTTWTDAESIRAEQGLSGGEAMPEAARLENVANRPDLFVLVDTVASAVPPLKLACDAFNAVAGLPIIRDISGAVSSIGTGAADLALKPAGSSVEELTNQGLAAIAGEGVNALAKGGEFGNLANAGAFMAGNDQAVAGGGTALSDTEVAQLKDQRNQLDAQERSQKTFIARYFDPYDSASLTGKAVDTMPHSVSQMAALLNPLRLFGSSFSSLNTLFAPKTMAAQKYDYGVKTYGFSLADQQDPRFDDPYANADIVEPQLQALNEKYGKCFGTSVDESGGLHSDKMVNVLKLEKDSEYQDCRGHTSTAYTPPSSENSGVSKLLARLNPFASPAVSAAAGTTAQSAEDVMFTRYRFYIADTIDAKSLACWEDNESACAELGFGNSGRIPQDESVGSGLQCPSDLSKTVSVSGFTYYQMPAAENGEYTFDPGAVEAQRYGQKELVCVLYTVAKNYKEKYGTKSTVKVGDLNASGHASHKWGVAADLNAKGALAAADSTDGAYNKEATIELGKMLVATGKIKNIWWCPSDDSAQKIKEYADSQNKPITIQCIAGHENHFHVDISAERGPAYTP
jgi:hypothetical protein